MEGDSEGLSDEQWHKLYGLIYSPKKTKSTMRFIFDYLIKKNKDAPESYTRIDDIFDELELNRGRIFNALSKFEEHGLAEHAWQVDKEGGKPPKGHKAYRLKDDWLDLL